MRLHCSFLEFPTPSNLVVLFRPVCGLVLGGVAHFHLRDESRESAGGTGVGLRPDAEWGNAVRVCGGLLHDLGDTGPRLRLRAAPRARSSPPRRRESALPRAGGEAEGGRRGDRLALRLRPHRGLPRTGRPAEVGPRLGLEARQLRPRRPQTERAEAHPHLLHRHVLLHHVRLRRCHLLYR